MALWEDLRGLPRGSSGKRVNQVFDRIAGMALILTIRPKTRCWKDVLHTAMCTPPHADSRACTPTYPRKNVGFTDGRRLQL